MTCADRQHLFWKYAVGLTLLIVVYLLLTVLRSLQSDFGVEIWSGLDEKYSKGEPDVYATSQTLVGLGVALVSGTVIALRDNRRAFFTSLSLCMAGFALVALSLLGWSARLLDAQLHGARLGGEGLHRLLPHRVVADRAGVHRPARAGVVVLREPNADGDCGKYRSGMNGHRRHAPNVSRPSLGGQRCRPRGR